MVTVEIHRTPRIRPDPAPHIGVHSSRTFASIQIGPKGGVISWSQRVPCVLIRFFILYSPYPPSLSALPIPTHPSLFQPADDSYSRFRWLPSPPSALHTSPTDVQMERGEIHSHDVHPHDRSDPSPPEASRTVATEVDALVDPISRLQPSLSPIYRRLGQGDLGVVGTRPIDAGGFADVWIGDMDDRRVAVKSYRCYGSADYPSIYKASYPSPLCVHAHQRPTDRGFAMKH